MIKLGDNKAARLILWMFDDGNKLMFPNRGQIILQIREGVSRKRARQLRRRSRQQNHIRRRILTRQSRRHINFYLRTTYIGCRAGIRDRRRTRFLEPPCRILFTLKRENRAEQYLEAWAVGLHEILVSEEGERREPGARFLGRDGDKVDSGL